MVLLKRTRRETRKNNNATNVALINEFIIETAKINQQQLDIQQNYSRSCYDRIVTNHVSPNSRREGTPTDVRKLRTNALHST